MIIRKRTPILGHPSFWQVLLEYQHRDEDELQLQGLRIEWLIDRRAEEWLGKSIPIEMTLYANDKRSCIYSINKKLGRRGRMEDELDEYVELEQGDIVQVRAKFPASIGQARVTLY